MLMTIELHQVDNATRNKDPGLHTFLISPLFSNLYTRHAISPVCHNHSYHIVSVKSFDSPLPPVPSPPLPSCPFNVTSTVSLLNSITPFMASPCFSTQTVWVDGLGLEAALRVANC
jgi:hypothetical protein